MDLDNYGSCLREIRPYLAKPICSESRFQRILEMAELFPPIWFGMLELHLYDFDNDPNVDLGIMLSNQAGVVDRYLDESHHHQPVQLRDSPPWKEVQTFLKLYQTPSYFLSSFVDRCWLAFDLGPNRQAIPWLYAGMTIGNYLPVMKPKIYKMVFQALGHEITPSEKNELITLEEHLPSGCRIHSLGNAKYRDEGRARLCIYSFNNRETLFLYLEKINRLGNFPIEDHQLDFLFSHAQYCMLGLGLKSDNGRKITLEFGLREENHKEISSEVFRFLIQEKMLDPGILEHVLAWLQPGGNGIKRKINHVKLTLEGASKVKVKAYFAFFNDSLLNAQ